MKADFSGYATVNDRLCSDGRTIIKDAFKHQDRQKIPLVWQHRHNEPINVLGHAFLENREDGVYAYAFFNDTEMGRHSKLMVQHGDITALSIHAGGLTQRGRNVVHGTITELSLVYAGANPEAIIDNVTIQHSDGGEFVELQDEAIIYTGETLQHEDMPDELLEEIQDEPDEKPGEETMTPPIKQPVEKTPEELSHADDERTVADVFDEFTEEHKNVTYFMIGEAVEKAESLSHSNENVTDEIKQHIQEGFETMTHNLFDQTGGTGTKDKPTLSHAQFAEIVADGKKNGSLKESFLSHAAEYGIEDIDFLFPDAKALTNTPEFISRRMEWVSNVLSSTKHAPFSRIKSVAADITADAARAKGYVKGNLKKDEVIRLLKRVTTPTTIYKKQKLDRDDMIDITELDVVVWLKAEMRIMLDEEIAISILIGDGRESDDEDKIDEDHIRPIAYDVDMYNTVVDLDGTPTPAETVDAIVRAQVNYKGTGRPTFYTTANQLTNLILDKDTLGRRLYATEAELAANLRVKEIVVVEAMERDLSIVGIIVNLADYTIGADKGGEINMFDDFDIDYNQNKYLIETRISGALTKPKSAITIKSNPGSVVTPAAPTFVAGTGVVTIPATTGVVYKNADTGATLSSGAQTAIAPNATIEIEAVPATGYSFPHGFDADWEFTRNA